MTRALRLATRGSGLALWQAERARDLLRAQGIPADIVVVETRGDAEPDQPLAALEGKGFFTKEIEDALLDRRADVAVHSLKDLPTTLPPGLTIGAVPLRGDPRDCLVTRDPAVRAIADLPTGARVGTSSLRRSAQLKALRPDLLAVPIRGNVPTRVDKVITGFGPDYHAAVLALAGLERLGLGSRAALVFDPRDLMPAPGQGAIALEIRSDDASTSRVVGRLTDPMSWAAVTAERALLAALEGGCRAPIAAYASSDRLEVRGRVIAVDGSAMVEASAPLDPRDPAAAGEAVARLLLERGADQLIHAAREAP